LVDVLQEPGLVAAVETAIGYEFRDGGLLERALTHSSFANERVTSGQADHAVDNERLEFLGDAVLQLTVSAWLFERFPKVPEGQLTQRRSAIVNAESLTRVAEHLQLGALLKIGVGEERSGGRTRPSNLADALEALLGAVFLDGGFEAAHQVVRIVFEERVAAVNSRSAKGPKSRLQEWAQARHHITPSYDLVGTTGPAHASRFQSEVRVLEIVHGRGEGTSKQDAEKAAAQHALEQLGID
jgi:ribonuclease III